MTTQGLEEELKQDYGNAAVTEVQPGSPDDPFSAANSQPNDSPPSTDEGEPKAEGASATEGTPGEPTQPSGEPSPTTEGPPEGKAPDEGDEDDDTSLTPEREQELRAKLNEEIRSELRGDEDFRSELLDEFREKELKPVQRGLDREVTSLRAQNEDLQKQYDELDRQIKESQIKDLPEEEKARIKEGWANEDRARELKRQEESLEKWHESIVARELVQDYGQYGVTFESLEQLEVGEDDDPMQVWRDHCKDQKIAFLEDPKNQKPSTEPTTTEPAPQQAPPEPSQPPPAGSRAPSDGGGSGVPPAPEQRDEGRGVDSMANNISGNGWEPAPAEFAGRRS